MTTEQTILAGRYRLLDVLGDGGMARVYRAEDTRLRRNVAIKMLHPEYQREPEFVRRFEQEARFSGGLSHPHIAAIFDIGVDDDRPFIVMECVAGGSLRSVLMRDRPLPLDRVLAITRQLGEALDAAHSHGVVHRDVKPENILLTADHQVKVSDFGIARALAANTAQTAADVILGSVTYLSPEQAQGKPVTAESDLYSLGVVLYELLTGRPPFRGQNPLATALQHLTQQPAAPSTIVPSLPRAVDGVVLRALSKEPQTRYHSGAALAAALAGAVGASPPAIAVPEHPRRKAATGRRRQESSGHRLPVLSLMMMLFLGGGAYAMGHMPRGETLAASSSRPAAAPSTATPTVPAANVAVEPYATLRVPADVPVTALTARRRLHASYAGAAMTAFRLAVYAPATSTAMTRPALMATATAVLPPPHANVARPARAQGLLPTVGAIHVVLTVARGVSNGFTPYHPTNRFESGAAAYVIARWNGVRAEQAVTLSWTTPMHDTHLYRGCAGWWAVCYTWIPLDQTGTYRVTFAVDNKTVAQHYFSVSAATPRPSAVQFSPVSSHTVIVRRAGHPGHGHGKKGH